MINDFVGELSGMDLFNSTCAPHNLMIFLMVSPPKETKTPTSSFLYKQLLTVDCPK